MKDLLVRLASQIPNRFWDCDQEDCLLPYYHMVSDEYIPHVSPLYQFRSVQEFEADLECFLQNRRPLQIGEFLQSVKETGKPPERSFLLTFDDGFREMYEIVLPILLRKGVPAVFFLSTATIDNSEMCHHQKISLLLNDKISAKGFRHEREVMLILSKIGIHRPTMSEALKAITWNTRTILDDLQTLFKIDFKDYARSKKPYVTSDEVRSLLNNGMGIGAHSIDHPCYPDIPFEEQLRQTRESITRLVKAFGMQPRAFAFPHTDDGVSAKFFETVSKEGTIELSFGTSGPQQDSIRFSFQRFSMEKTNLPAEAIIARNSLRMLKLRMKGAVLADRA